MKLANFFADFLCIIYNFKRLFSFLFYIFHNILYLSIADTIISCVLHIMNLSPIFSIKMRWWKVGRFFTSYYNPPPVPHFYKIHYQKRLRFKSNANLMTLESNRSLFQIFLIYLLLFNDWLLPQLHSFIDNINRCPHYAKSCQ